MRSIPETWSRPSRRSSALRGAPEVYNLGGGRHANCSVIEAIALTEEISGRTIEWSYDETNRVGDHIWWIGDNGRFASHYPGWSLTYDIPAILREIYEANTERWKPGA